MDWKRSAGLGIGVLGCLMLFSQCGSPQPDCKAPDAPSRCAAALPDAAGGVAPDEASSPEPGPKPDRATPPDKAAAPDGQSPAPERPSSTDASPVRDASVTDRPAAPDRRVQPPTDECDSTDDCKAKYGARATDCVDSRSEQSVCQCGASRCKGGAPPDAAPPERGPAPDKATTDGVPTDKTPPGRTTFVEKNGYIVMEMESTPIPSGHSWRKQTALKGYAGSGYYRFTGNGICSGPAKDPLRYTFTVVKAATFQLHLRCARIYHCVKGKPHNAKGHCGETDRTCTSLGQPVNGACKAGECIRTDISNDAFVSIEDARGTYVPFVNQPRNTVGQPIKLFGGGYNAWGWSGKRALDISGKHDAHWKLSPGAYTLVIRGRSQAFRIDRMVLFDAATGSTRVADTLSETR